MPQPLRARRTPTALESIAIKSIAFCALPASASRHFHGPCSSEQPPLPRLQLPLKHTGSAPIGTATRLGHPGPALVGQLQLRLIVLDAERGAVAAALTVGSPQCSGGLDSLGQWQRGTLVLKPYRPEPDAAACEVQVRVDADGRRAWVSETGWGAEPGAACVFEGQWQARWGGLLAAAGAMKMAASACR